MMCPLYFIADPGVLFPTMSLIEIVTQAMDGGARLIQYRDKKNTRRVIYENALRLRELTGLRGVTFLVNDQVDIALSIGADGAHLGQQDLPLGAARKVLGDKAIIGLSTHTLPEAICAEQDGADYIGWGPLFPTSTKADARRPLGIESIAQVKQAVRIPVYVIGGIQKAHLPIIRAAGADGVAAISALLLGDVKSNVQSWLTMLSAGEGEKRQGVS